MKKLLLSSAVMLFLCSVSFAQAKKTTVFPKEPIVTDQKAQAELEKKKLLDYQASLVPMTPQQEAKFQAEKLRNEKQKAAKAPQSTVSKRTYNDTHFSKVD